MIANQSHFKWDTTFFCKSHCRDNSRIGNGNNQVRIYWAFLCHGPAHFFSCCVNMFAEQKTVGTREINMFKNTVFAFYFFKRKKGLQSVFINKDQLPRFHFANELGFNEIHHTGF